jgi:hypothetical protein
VDLSLQPGQQPATVEAAASQIAAMLFSVQVAGVPVAADGVAAAALLRVVKAVGAGWRRPYLAPGVTLGATLLLRPLLDASMRMPAGLAQVVHGAIQAMHSIDHAEPELAYDVAAYLGRSIEARLLGETTLGGFDGGGSGALLPVAIGVGTTVLPQMQLLLHCARCQSAPQAGDSGGGLPCAGAATTPQLFCAAIDSVTRLATKQLMQEGDPSTAVTTQSLVDALAVITTVLEEAPPAGDGAPHYLPPAASPEFLRAVLQQLQLQHVKHEPGTTQSWAERVMSGGS